MANLSFGDGVLFGAVVLAVCYALYLTLTAKAPSASGRFRPTRQSVARQPDPIGGDGQVPVYEYVLADLEALDEMMNTTQFRKIAADIEARAMDGKIKYGKHLNICNSRSMLIDAYQEALDLMLYAKGAQLEAELTHRYDVAGLAVRVQAHAGNALTTMAEMFSLQAQRNEAVSRVDVAA